MMKLNELMDQMNYNLHARKNGVPSTLGDIERSIVDVFVNSPKVTLDDIEDFEANLIGNSNVLGDDRTYSSVNGINGYFNEMVIDKEKALMDEISGPRKTL